MKCTNCDTEFTTERTGFVVCPHCGVINLSSEVGNGEHMHSSGTMVVASQLHKNKAKRSFFSNKKLLFVIALVLIASLGGVSSAYLLVKSKNKPISKPVTAVVVSSNSLTPTTTTTNTTQAQTTPQQKTPVTSPTKTQPTTETLETILATINKKLAPFGVVATFSPAAVAGDTWNTLNSSDLSSLQKFEPFLTEEFAKYPKDLVANSGLKTVGLVKSLKIGTQARSATPAPETTSVIYDVVMMAGSGSEYSREAIIHEYWHYLDYKMRSNYYYDDDQWRACNTSGFTYGGGGSSAYGNSSYTTGFHPQSGIITTYSTYGIEEDRAEMFAWLIYNPSAVKNLNDSGINCKINRLTAIARQLSPNISF